jgi:uncharacterized membrane protein
VAIAIAAATILGLIVLWPRGEARQDFSELGFTSEVHAAEVIDVETVPCPGSTPDLDIPCRRLILELRQGPDEGSITTIDFPLTEGGMDFTVGEEVVLNRIPGAPAGSEYQFADRQRRLPLLWLALLFAGAVVLLGRLRGLAALAGLGVSFVVLLKFVLPAILQGRSPLLVALVGAAAIAYLALYLAHGVNLMTTTALLGTLASLALTAILANVFVEIAKITGLTTEEALLVRIGAAEVDLAGLVLAGVVIGALGAIDDMTVTQASAVSELQAANPEFSERQLRRASMRIGRDHVASTVNTLVLAYAGASLPILILFVFSAQSLGAVANSEVIATEVIRTLVGSVGLVASVPVTTWLAVRVAPQLVRGSPRVETARNERTGES